MTKPSSIITPRSRVKVIADSSSFKGEIGVVKSIARATNTAIVKLDSGYQMAFGLSEIELRVQSVVRTTFVK
jgi:hypothetical protein